MEMEECPESELPAYLRRLKEEGYALVGLEQTVTSKTLGKVEFPEKMALVLGKEKEGIPAKIIQMLDLCIEIPQFGIIRSLNVHVSGSILIWEYISLIVFLHCIASFFLILQTRQHLVNEKSSYVVCWKLLEFQFLVLSLLF